MEIYPLSKTAALLPSQAPASADSNADAEEQARPVRVQEQPDRAREQARTEPRDVEKAAEAVNDLLAIEKRRIRLRVDERADAPVISVVDVESDEVVRQLPAEHVLKLAKFRDENPPFPEPDSVSRLLDEQA